MHKRIRIWKLKQFAVLRLMHMQVEYTIKILIRFVLRILVRVLQNETFVAHRWSDAAAAAAAAFSQKCLGS